jgi:hypothetical protein
MWRIPVGLGLIALGVVGVYQLMVWDTHFLLLALFGAGCGTAAGWVFVGRRGLIVGAVLGFLTPLAYLPLWFVFDLPPKVGINL